MAAESLLDQLIEDTREGSSAPAAQVAAGPRQAIKKVNYSHDGMINLILTHRGISQNEIGAHFGYSASWVSQIMSSDAFQARLAERAAEIEDPTLRATAEENLKGVLHRSLELLKEKLNQPAAAIPDNLVLRSVELATRALGYGAKADPNPGVQINGDVYLDHLGGRIVGLLAKVKSEQGGGLHGDLPGRRGGRPRPDSTSPRRRGPGSADPGGRAGWRRA